MLGKKIVLSITKNYKELGCFSTRCSRNWIRGIELIIWSYFEPEKIELQK